MRHHQGQGPNCHCADCSAEWHNEDPEQHERRRIARQERTLYRVLDRPMGCPGIQEYVQCDLTYNTVTGIVDETACIECGQCRGREYDSGLPVYVMNGLID